MEFDSFVLAATTDDLSRAVAAECGDAVEFRLDLTDASLEQLSGHEGELPIIATNRVEWEGSEAADTPERLDTLRNATEHHWSRRST